MEIPAYHPFRSTAAKERYLKFYALREQRWPVASESRLVETSYGQTFVRISGPASAEPLVLLHGAASSTLMWVPNIKALSERYKTYTVDGFYGCGLSRPTRPARSPDDLADWLEELFAALELGSAVSLVGLSYGGWLISQYALRFPSRLHKLVLLAPAATVLPIRAEVVARAILGALPHRRFARNFFRWMFADLARKDETGRMLEDSVDAVLMARLCFSPRRLVRPTVLTDEELGSITRPVFFLVGENERLYSPGKAVERLSRAAPAVKTEVIPRAGHDLTFVQPELVNLKIIEFLDKP
jgi:pimeloyl-ACP methyl ester carboxylesterase